MFDIDQQEESLRILRNLISIHIEKGTLDNKFLPIIIKDAQFLAEDLSDHKRLHKIDRANYNYSTYFGRNFDKDWLDQFDPENLSTEDYKKILDDIKGDDLYDKDGNKLDIKYVNILSELPEDEIYDKNGNKLKAYMEK